MLSIEEVNKLVVENMPKIKAMVDRAAKNLPSHISKEDLYQNAFLEVLKKAAEYDPSSGNTFATFCDSRVSGSVIDFLREEDVLSRAERKKVKESGVTSTVLVQTSYLAETLHLEDFFISSEDIFQHPIFGGRCIRNMVHETEEADLLRYLNSLMDTVLIPRDKEIVWSCFEQQQGRGWNQRFQLTQCRVSQIKKEAIDKVRKRYLHEKANGKTAKVM